MTFVARVVVSAIALWLTSLLLPGRLQVIDDGTWLGTVLSVLAVALVLCLVNLLIRPVVKVLSIPLYLLTLGLFSLVVNAFMLWITTSITSSAWFADHLGIQVSGGFWSYFLTAAVLALLQVVLGGFAGNSRRGRGDRSVGDRQLTNGQ